MEVVYRLGLKLPVEGIQYSNIEQSIEWTVQGENVDEVLVDLEKKIAVWLEKQMESVGGTVKNTIQDRNTKLAQAREDFIKLNSKQ